MELSKEDWKGIEKGVKEIWDASTDGILRGAKADYNIYRALVDINKRLLKLEEAMKLDKEKG